MRKFDVIILVVLMVLSALDSFGAVLSHSNAEQKSYFANCFENQGPGCQPVDVVYQSLMKEVTAELEHEAFVSGQSRDAYVCTDAAFRRTLSALQSDEVKAMDRADLMISLVKLSMRYHFIKSARFRAPQFTENEAVFLRVIRGITAEHNLPFQY